MEVLMGYNGIFIEFIVKWYDWDIIGISFWYNSEITGIQYDLIKY